MIKGLRIFFIVALATIFSCNHLEKHLKGDDEKEDKSSIITADKVEFSKSDPPLGRDYGRDYNMTITATELRLSIQNQKDEELLNKRFPFNKEKFDKLLQSLKGLKNKGEEIPNSDIPDGGSTRHLYIYKGDNKIFEGVDYGGSATNFTGGEIDISYLVDDLNEIINSTKKEN